MEKPLKCQQCGFEQQEGKFCGKCGNKLVADQVEEQTQVSITQEQSGTAPKQNQPVGTSSDSLEKMKATSKMYGTYVVQYLKRPAMIFSRSRAEFKNGFINLMIFAVLWALISGIIGEKFMSSFSLGMSSSVFLPIFIRMFIYTAILLAIIIGLILLIDKLFVKKHSIYDIASIYGTHLIPVNVVLLLSLLLFIIDSYEYGSFLLGLSSTLMLIIIPFYLVSVLLHKDRANIDPLYGYFLYIIGFFIAMYIILNIVADSAIGDIIDELWYFL